MSARSYIPEPCSTKELFCRRCGGQNLHKASMSWSPLFLIYQKCGNKVALSRLPRGWRLWFHSSSYFRALPYCIIVVTLSHTFDSFELPSITCGNPRGLSGLSFSSSWKTTRPRQTPHPSPTLFRKYVHYNIPQQHAKPASTCPIVQPRSNPRKKPGGISGGA